MKTISKFDGTKYAFLSNFYTHPVKYKGITYPTSEHAFQAWKSTDVKIRRRIAKASTPAKAKSMGRSITKRPDWDQVKRRIMLAILREKFRNPMMAGKLLSTGNAELVEGNTWGDTYWGVCGGQGENWLGHLLMIVRKDLRDIIKEHL